MRRLLSIPGITFAVFLAWKVGLLLFTSQPVPSNDAFFYDGPVVNYVLHGQYCNPALANVLPISGTKVFSAYPPLYQGVLWAWLKCFGPGELAAMWLHVVLLAIFAATILAIFRALQLPAVAVNTAGLFLFGITFHDRPDTLAHVLGALAVLAVVRNLIWPAAVFLLLTFGTSLQIGGIYSLWLAGLVLGQVWLGKIKFPWAVALTFFAVLLGLIASVKFAHPLWWDGFQEHVKITPSVTGWRVPRADDFLKVIRTAPGIALVLAGLLMLLIKGGSIRDRFATAPALPLATAGSLAALGLICGCLLVLTPNTVHIAGYLQPVIVGGFLAATSKESRGLKPGMIGQILFLGAALLVSVRAIGQTTWGAWCARDVSRAQALQHVNRELDAVVGGSSVFVSAAYLYESAARTNINWIHSDWPAPAVGADWELRAIEILRPARLLLTQFDYYRRYEVVVAQLRRQRGDVNVRIINTARVQPPDAIPATRKVVQHVSWAPVIVEFSWPQSGESK